MLASPLSPKLEEDNEVGGLVWGGGKSSLYSWIWSALGAFFAVARTRRSAGRGDGDGDFWKGNEQWRGRWGCDWTRGGQKDALVPRQCGMTPSERYGRQQITLVIRVLIGKTAHYTMKCSQSDLELHPLY
jgi:hypothetical protein